MSREAIEAVEAAIARERLRRKISGRMNMHAKRAIAYLRNSEGGVYVLKQEKIPVGYDYCHLAEVALTTTAVIVEAMPDDYFEDFEGGSLLGLPASRSNLSDGLLEQAEAVLAAVKKRRAHLHDARLIAKLENAEGRTPEEAAAFRAKAEQLRRKTKGAE